MASTRLRKTFQHQEDSDDGDEPLAMDEQEQEELITRLKQENDEKNATYLHLFFIIPSSSWLIFVLAIIRSSAPSAKLICVLGITSLAATAYNLLLIPTAQRPKIGSYEVPLPSSLSPAQQYVPLLNGALSVLIALWGLSFRPGIGVIGGFWMFCWVPLVEYLMIQMARKWIVEVDPAELEKLRYEFKGA